MFNFISHKKRKKIIILAIILALFVYLILALKVFKHYPLKIDLEHRSGEFGATFSKKFAQELELDWKEAYQAIIGELGVRYLRLPAYWDEIEKEESVYSFEDMDYLVSEASAKDVKIIISLGRRQPRWPECHSPAWTNRKSAAKNQASLLKLIEEVVLRYKDNPNIIYWQVENEPFLGTFGVCPEFDEMFFEREIALVKSLDSRPIIITGSGEMSLWRQEAKAGDVLGVTMYRVVYNSWFGYVRYFFPTSFYTLKTYLAGTSPSETINMELQTEPWVPQGKMIYLNKKQIDKSMSLRQLEANLQYAINTGFKQTYVWGVEWWYWQKLYGNEAYWEIGKKIFD